jgi:hypothetical protein
MDRRTTLYNRTVTHYHKAKLGRADLARELATVKGKILLLSTRCLLSF